MKKILIMGLPGSGKTYLARELVKRLPNTIWFNADEIRKKYNDWDFSKEGRIRQSLRMAEYANESNASYVICDFVCPYPEMRDNFNADFVIWVDTIKEGRFEDTNQIFVSPVNYDIRVTEQNSKKWANIIVNRLLNKETYIRSLYKAISWRITGTIDTFIISCIITGEPLIASGIALTEIFTKICLYWLHERLWNNISLGRE